MNSTCFLIKEAQILELAILKPQDCNSAMLMELLVQARTIEEIQSIQAKMSRLKIMQI